MNKQLKFYARAAMYARIQKHGEQLNAIFGTHHDPIELCKKLRRIEVKQNRANVDYCNGTMTSDQHDQIEAKTRAALKKLLGETLPIYINSDPCGYALKIEAGMMQALQTEGKPLHTDWGGYGILAPDLTND